MSSVVSICLSIHRGVKKFMRRGGTKIQCRHFGRFAFQLVKDKSGNYLPEERRVLPSSSSLSSGSASRASFPLLRDGVTASLPPPAPGPRPVAPSSWSAVPTALSRDGRHTFINSSVAR